MQIVFTHKRNGKVFSKPLPSEYRTMLQLCANDLVAMGWNGKVRVVFQTGQSQIANRIYGYCEYAKGHVPIVYVYTYRQRKQTVLKTLAHEFGHVSHFVTIPTSMRWSKAHKEQYAELYETLMFQRYEQHAG